MKIKKSDFSEWLRTQTHIGAELKAVLGWAIAVGDGVDLGYGYDQITSEETLFIDLVSRLKTNKASTAYSSTRIATTLFDSLRINAKTDNIPLAISQRLIIARGQAVLLNDLHQHPNPAVLLDGFDRLKCFSEIFTIFDANKHGGMCDLLLQIGKCQKLTALDNSGLERTQLDKVHAAIRITDMLSHIFVSLGGDVTFVNLIINTLKTNPAVPQQWLRKFSAPAFDFDAAGEFGTQLFYRWSADKVNTAWLNGNPEDYFKQQPVAARRAEPSASAFAVAPPAPVTARAAPAASSRAASLVRSAAESSSADERKHAASVQPRQPLRVLTRTLTQEQEQNYQAQLRAARAIAEGRELSVSVDDRARPKNKELKLETDPRNGSRFFYYGPESQKEKITVGADGTVIGADGVNTRKTYGEYVFERDAALAIELQKQFKPK